jgi:hypothetical protein
VEESTTISAQRKGFQLACAWRDRASSALALSLSLSLSLPLSFVCVCLFHSASKAAKSIFKNVRSEFPHAFTKSTLCDHADSAFAINLMDRERRAILRRLLEIFVPSLRAFLM